MKPYSILVNPDHVAAAFRRLCVETSSKYQDFAAPGSRLQAAVC